MATHLASRLFACLACLLPVAAAAQQGLGSLKTEGAQITGTVAVSGGRATIANNGSIEAGLETAEISLTRGGAVKVCTGSSARLSQPAVEVARPPLLMALNRGGMEVKTTAQMNDVILTPDFRFQVSDSAPLNLRVRLVANGDTCVDNSGKDAPILHATEAFGTGAYFIQPGQRVLLEHGSLRDVVDHESSSCGCPRTEPLVLAGKGKHGDGKVTEAAKKNPFPEAVSQGLQAPTVPQAPSDQTHVQVSTTLNYNGVANTATGPPGDTIGPPTADPAAAPPATSGAASKVSSGSSSSSEAAHAGVPAGRGAPPQTAGEAHIETSAPPAAGPNPFRAIGHFFRRLFGAK
ncbi:MAG: hypothetical protein ACRYGF_11335 [Janthinobacterium lividum]